MKFISAAVIAASIVLVLPANAADVGGRLYAKAPVMPDPAYNWTGFYVGGSFGYHESRDRSAALGNPDGFAPDFQDRFNQFSPGTVRPRGVAGGVQAGYNWQSRNVVFGIESDVTFLDGRSSREVLLFGANPFTSSASSDYIATFRPRLGLTVDRAFFYATGGLAVATLKTTDTFGFFAGNLVSVGNSSNTRAGWTVGVGGEYAITNQWSAKIEYLYADFGSFKATIPACPGCLFAADTDITVSHRFTENLVRAGINYHFDSPAIARY